MSNSCAYCNKPFAQFKHAVTVCSGGRLYLFCSHGCRDLYDGFRKLTNRICTREDCNNRVPEGNRMLCSACHKRGNHLSESEASLDEAERAHWERLERELHGRIEGNARIYSSQDMTQEELRSLVSSLKDKAA